MFLYDFLCSFDSILNSFFYGRLMNGEVKVHPKLLQCNDFKRLKKNKKSIFAQKLLKTLQEFEIGTLPNMTSSRPRDRVT